jgi:hypothetical protein
MNGQFVKPSLQNTTRAMRTRDTFSKVLPEGSPVQLERLVAHGKAAETIVQVAEEKPL